VATCAPTLGAIRSGSTARRAGRGRQADNEPIRLCATASRPSDAEHGTADLTRRRYVPSDHREAADPRRLAAGQGVAAEWPAAAFEALASWGGVGLGQWAAPHRKQLVATRGSGPVVQARAPSFTPACQPPEPLLGRGPVRVLAPHTASLARAGRLLCRTHAAGTPFGRIRQAGANGGLGLGSEAPRRRAGERGAGWIRTCAVREAGPTTGDDGWIIAPAGF